MFSIVHWEINQFFKEKILIKKRNILIKIVHFSSVHEFWTLALVDLDSVMGPYL